MIWIGSGMGWGLVRDRPGVDSVAAGYSLSIDCARRLAAHWLGRGARLYRALGEPPALLRSAGLDVHSLICGVRSDGAADLAPNSAPTTQVTQTRFSASFVM